jgi:hypothetical protein
MLIPTRKLENFLGMEGMLSVLWHFEEVALESGAGTAFENYLRLVKRGVDELKERVKFGWI